MQRILTATAHERDMERAYIRPNDAYEAFQPAALAGPL